MVVQPPTPAFPQADAEGCIAHNLRRLGHLDVPGGAQVVCQNGYAFVGHMSPPAGTSIIDVRDPANPKIAASIDLPEDHTHSHKVVVSGDLMLVNSQRNRRKFFRKAERLDKMERDTETDHGRKPTDAEIIAALDIKPADLPLLRKEQATGYAFPGFRVFDVSDPARPAEIGFHKTGGYGVHGFDFDGRYAYVSTEMEGYRGNILVVYDLADPARPVETSRWCLPGQEAGPNEGTSPRGGAWLHHALKTGDQLWAACCLSGVWSIDISDVSAPRTLGSYNYHPPFVETTHTAMALPQEIDGRKLALVIDEEHANHPPGQPHAALWIFDVTDPRRMFPLSVFEVSELGSPWSRTGTFGASQIVERPTGTRVYATWFAGGLRVVDISKPAAPLEIACFIPPPPSGASAPQSMDADVDERGLVYLLDRNGGLDILEPLI